MKRRGLRVLVVGGGGREHALAWKLAQSPRVAKLYAAPGNAGIAGLATCLAIGATDLDGLLRAAREIEADLTVVGPDDPLAQGLVDRLQAAGLAAFGPTAAAARIESSKAFAKALMRRAGIPTGRHEVFDEAERAARHISAHFAENPSEPVVLKADGLALGKGVVITLSESEALAAAREMLSGRAFGEAGRRVVVEEYLQGPEVSALAFTDGRHVLPMVGSRDHKRAFDGDQGPNTGGMGTITPVPGYGPELAEEVHRRVLEPAVAALAESGAPFVGVLYAGLILTRSGPKVLEFNARFGDPEAQVLVRRLDSDLVDVLEACVGGGLSPDAATWGREAAACVVMASGGYPGPYQKGVPITGVAEAESLEGVIVFHAGTARDDSGRLVTAGGRVLGVSATGADLGAALDQAYAAAERINFAGAHYRRDIGRTRL